MNISDAQVYTDIHALSNLRQAAGEDSPEAMRAVAEQFEALFMQMMLKNMRSANVGEGLFDNDQSKMYQDMYDKQLSVTLSTKSGLGLTDIIMRQLGGENASEKTITEMTMPERSSNYGVREGTAFVIEKPIETPDEFAIEMRSMANDAAQVIGVSPKVLVAQAALESGWGKGVIKHIDGASSHNLFGIKADDTWQGDRVRATTLEYRDGIAVREVHSFRSYDSYADSFSDYADFIVNQPRYAQALTQTDQPLNYLKAIHEAGYATDPAYSDKVSQIYKGDVLNRAEQETVAVLDKATLL